MMVRLTAYVDGTLKAESYGDTRAELYGFVGWMVEVHRDALSEVRAALEDSEDETYPFWTPEVGFDAFDSAPAEFRARVIWGWAAA